MFGAFLKGLLTFLLGLTLGAGFAKEKPPADSELQQKVQDHMDVIVDESAAIVDDVMEEFRQNEKVQEAEEFADDVREIIDNTKQDIDDHFGPEEESESMSEAEEDAMTDAPDETPA